jgi:hypothetical protein
MNRPERAKRLRLDYVEGRGKMQSICRGHYEHLEYIGVPELARQP